MGKWVSKVLLAGIAAFFILNALCLFYYNIPIHTKNPTGATDYVWEKEKFYSRATEGAAWGKTDKNGYNNKEVPERIDILLMGSSQMEAFNVAQDENTAAFLQRMLKENGIDYQVYNIGVSGHYFLTCLNNLKNAVAAYKPEQYVIIETSSLSFAREDLELVKSGQYPTIPSTENELLVFLQKFPYLRRLYTQISNLPKKQSTRTNADETGQSDIDTETEIEEELEKKKNDDEKNRLLEQVLQEGVSVARDNGCSLVVFYHPILKIEPDRAYDPANFSEKETFARLCDENGILFLDMTDCFLKSYRDTSVLPHGFSNTRIGVGHLNRYGHQMIAEELFQIIKNNMDENQY